MQIVNEQIELAHVFAQNFLDYVVMLLRPVNYAPQRESPPSTNVCVRRNDVAPALRTLCERRTRGADHV
jgi:hypothetical protein